MLRFSVNTKEMKSELVELAITGDCSYNINSLIIPMTVGNIRVGDVIHLKREDGSSISYHAVATVQSVSSTSITVDYSYPIEMKPIAISKSSDEILPMTQDSDYLLFKFGQHYFRKNRDNIVINSILPKDYTFSNTATTQCIDYKYFTYNSQYLYKSKEKDDVGNFIIISNNFENYNGISMSDGTAMTFSNGFIPISGLVDDTQWIWFPWSSSYETYLNDNELPILSCKDPRFFSDKGNGLLSLNDGTTLYWEKNSSITIGLNDAFTPKISIEEDIKENYLDGRIEKSINPIIDYEKRMFEPIYLTNYNTGNTIMVKDVDKITFNLYFRDREVTDEDWILNESGGWNRDKYTGFTATDTKYGDMLGDIGFTDNDIFNSNKRFAKSFIRLSFFDSPDKKKQVLQFYSTMFFDTTDMYDRYMKNKRTVVLTDGKEYCETPNIYEDKSLSCTFSCSSKRDAMSSSEGFYLYLYDSLLEGTKPTPLYMLVEFNHAKCGKTIPMMMPVRKSGSELLPLDYKGEGGYGFPRGYLKKTSSGNTYTDMTQFYNDLFIKVYIKYDEVSNRYVWYLPRSFADEEQGKNWVFNLYEPRIVDPTNYYP